MSPNWTLQLAPNGRPQAASLTWQQPLLHTAARESLQNIHHPALPSLQPSNSGAPTGPRGTAPSSRALAVPAPRVRFCHAPLSPPRLTAATPAFFRSLHRGRPGPWASLSPAAVWDVLPNVKSKAVSSEATPAHPPSQYEVCMSSGDSSPPETSSLLFVSGPGKARAQQPSS